MGTWEAAQEEDGHPGGGQLTETREVTKEGGAREKKEGSGAGRAWRDPGHSHNGGPRWSRRREEPWRRNDCQLKGTDQRRRSR